MVPIDWKSFIRRYAGLLLVIEGAFFENLFGPSYFGWGFIIFGLFWEWVWPNRHYVNLPVHRFVWILIFLSAASIWVTANRPVTIAQVSQLAASAFCFLTISCWLQSGKQRQLFTMGFIGLGFTLAFAAPFMIEWQANKGGLVPDSFYQIMPVLLSDPVHPNIMATLMVLLFPLPLIISIRQWQNGRLGTFWLFGLAALAMLGILFLTRSRGGYLAAAVGIMLISGVMGYRRWAITIFVITTLLIGIFIFIEPGSNSSALSDLSNTDTFAFRLQVWQLALNMIRDFPFTGVGMGDFNAVAERLYPFPPMADPSAHNLYLQVAVDLGLIGLAAWLGILGTSLGKGWRLYWRDGEGSAVFLGLLIGTTSYAVHGLIDLTVWGTRMTIVPWLVLAALTPFLFQREAVPGPAK